MAASDCTLVKGTRLVYGTDGATYPNTFADLVEIGPPGSLKRPKIDKTPLDPFTSNREYGLGLGEPGVQTFKQLWTRARETALVALVGVPTYYRVLYPDSATNVDANKSSDSFYGSISGLTKEPMPNADARLVLDVEITISGPITFVSGTGV